MLPYKLTSQEETTLSYLRYNQPFFSIHFSEESSFFFFNEFSNWLQGEFDLFFKEEHQNTLKIYFPNGHTIVSINQNEEISICSLNKNSQKCKNSMLKLLRSYQFYKKIKPVKY